ncbi:MAG: tRNA (adenosine(37)-N6)-threonylcarbamoyltransferase complex dimerization subunit type 1 TsaB [Candidatus Omnitrophica bacterium]|nr:tRNA (adenosine(37)-N6)-threonylcarbamoyltransferase complex dimerization subunit type 1 TsaB [Candidatus Omnitrophota bacterium]
MNLLVVDASSENISLAIKYKGKLVADFNRKKRFGASLLIQQIDRQLSKNKLSLKSMDAFVVGSGPGSFTGLRISFSVIKAFMLVTKKPTIEVGSSYSLAYALRNKSSKIAVISDARRGLIYGVCFKSRLGVLRKEAKEKLYKLEEFIKNKEDYLFCTYDKDLRDQVSNLNKKIGFYDKDLYPKARDLLLEAELCYNQGKFTTIDKLKPLYLHPKTCQIQKK